MKLSELFILAGLCSSNKEFKRLLLQGAISVNNTVMTNSDLLVVVIDGQLRVAEIIR